MRTAVIIRDDFREPKVSYIRAAFIIYQHVCLREKTVGILGEKSMKLAIRTHTSKVAMNHGRLQVV